MPWQSLIEDAADDRGHKARWRRGSFVAADPLCPLELDLFCARVIEIFAVGNVMRSQRIDQRISFSLVDKDVALDLHASGQSLEIDGYLRGKIFLQPLVHQIEGGTDGERRDCYTDQEPHLLPERRGADQIAGLEVLVGGASDGCGDPDYATNHEREHLLVGRGPSGEEKDGTSRHQCSDAHTTNG